jgi:4-hydroxythreonine-4-phosphate dehydrogenase
MSAPLAFTCGDPAGIGPEVIAAWLAAHPADARDVAVVGPARWLASLPAAGAKVAVGLEEFGATPGEPTGEGALVAWAAMERAAAGCAAGEFGGVVTGPVSKDRLARLGYPYPGQTEFFAARWGGEPTMAFCGGKLCVVLLTWHIPLRDVPAQLTAANFARAVRAAEVLARAWPVAASVSGGKEGGSSPLARSTSSGPRVPRQVRDLELVETAGRGAHARSYVPRIGVCGLNPHAGEAGLLGAEERDIIDPILNELRRTHPGLSRCEPGDTLFGRQLRGEFDVVIALYHDQGLAPLKVIDFDEAVNVTLGLPHVRTSPDHGTAYGIAGQGVASPRSFANAVTVARLLMGR